MSGDRVIVASSTDDGTAHNDGSAYVINASRSPANVRASDGTVAAQVQIQWQDDSAVEDGFIIYRDGVEIATVGADIEFYNDAAALTQGCVATPMCWYTPAPSRRVFPSPPRYSFDKSRAE